MMKSKRIRNLLLGALLSGFFIFVLGAAILVISGLRDDIQNADVAIVLGNTVELNGEPSARLKARLDKTVELYEKRLFPEIIVSGGFGREGFDEAVVMRDYLVAHGIPASYVHLDSEGNNTYLTAKNSARIMNEKSWHSALVITQYFHVPRTRLAFQRFGISPVYSAHANYFELRDIYSTAREVVAYCSYFVRGSE